MDSTVGTLAMGDLRWWADVSMRAIIGVGMKALFAAALRRAVGRRDTATLTLLESIRNNLAEARVRRMVRQRARIEVQEAELQGSQGAQAHPQRVGGTTTLQVLVAPFPSPEMQQPEESPAQPDSRRTEKERKDIELKLRYRTVKRKGKRAERNSQPAGEVKNKEKRNRARTEPGLMEMPQHGREENQTARICQTRQQAFASRNKLRQHCRDEHEVHKGDGQKNGIRLPDSNTGDDY